MKKLFLLVAVMSFLGCEPKYDLNTFLIGDKWCADVESPMCLIYTASRVTIKSGDQTINDDTYKIAKTDTETNKIFLELSSGNMLIEIQVIHNDTITTRIQGFDETLKLHRVKL